MAQGKGGGKGNGTAARGADGAELKAAKAATAASDAKLKEAQAEIQKLKSSAASVGSTIAEAASAQAMEVGGAGDGGVLALAVTKAKDEPDQFKAIPISVRPHIVGGYEQTLASLEGRLGHCSWSEEGYQPFQEAVR